MGNPKDLIGAYIRTELVPGQALQDGDELLLSGRLDSLGVMSLVAFIEKACAIKIPFDDVLIENFESIDAIDAFVARKSAEMAG